MKRLVLLILISTGFSCNSNKLLVDNSLMESTLLDTLVVSARPIDAGEDSNTGNVLPTYHASFNKNYEIIHTALDLAFDWDNEWVLGTATLDLSPVFYKNNVLELDAVGYDIESIKGVNKQDLSYGYNDKIITIELDQVYTRNDTFQIEIKYISKPSEQETGGSKAITSDKGLFFINSKNDNHYKPQQIWTQGETQHNSKWFPTIDRPNIKFTQEIKLRVDQRFSTLSNGLLISSTDHPDGTRTDHWKQSLRHTPYLAMIAVGDFAKVQDQWRDLPVSYYVEPEYEKDAKVIFNHTPEMLEFFSNKLDFPYPWEKYAQIVVRDFVSGAMENTTASVFGEFVQKNTQELIDNSNDNIVAHELFHHWFGDLVTCENWANLTLNEGFANYSEYLWQEHKYGVVAADHHRHDEMKTYVESSLNRTHPLIHYSYEDKEDMFDAHSYNKGGLVLHMLRNIVGDEAFFTSLNKYLVDNAFSVAEADQLRLAFEEVTGLDLNWFFNQWYFESGHPILKVDYSFDFKSNDLTIAVEQVQEDFDHKYIYQLPTDIAVYFKNGSVEYYPVEIKQRKQSFTFNLEEEPAVTVLDGNRYLLAEIQEVFSTSQLKSLYQFSPNFADKKLALTKLRNNERAKETFAEAINDEYFHFRKLGLSYRYLEIEEDLLESLALNDENSKIRKSALQQLTKRNEEKAFALAMKIIENEQAIPVLSQAIKSVFLLDKEMGILKAEELYGKYKNTMSILLLDLFAKSNDPKYLGYLNQAVLDADIYRFFPISNDHFELASNCGPEDIMTAIKALYSIAIKKEENSYKKYISTTNIAKLKDTLLDQQSALTSPDKGLSAIITEIDKLIEEIILQEEDESLLEKYRTNLGT